MGVKKEINIKHATDGYSFKLDVDRDADALGIKVLIWEVQMVPVETQRLVFNGKEIKDGTTINELGIDDGDTLFLIEIKKQEVEATADVETIAITPIPQRVEKPMIELSVQREEDAHDAHYLYLDALSDEVRESKIHSVVKLSCWIRSYLWFGFMITLFATFLCCVGSALPCIFYIFGLIGARKLNKCLLVFPIILTAVIGFGGLTVNVIW
eukprot:CAMPEP_0197031316 /NCGR_PEP_ID=MMETSP1384-20130603/10357_1 /TAXON_ID=29189 /ORGANISM="Ammonia sp." /LENGTH=210 /DNA_ID=CAMNT_0042460827 /DNA_START=46 /DNA_END=675 /DNA_ORIENTATION=-